MDRKLKVTYTVAECSEFHHMGEYHDGIKTVKEAVDLYNSIPPERMNAIPSIGIALIDANTGQDFAQFDLVTRNGIDMDMLNYYPYVEKNTAAQYGIAEILYRFKELEVHGNVPKDIRDKVKIVENREQGAERLKDITDKLEQGVKDVFESDNYKEFLKTMAKFPRYSVNNSILIMMQKPEASLCQSFTGWKQMGRYVKKGEKGIKILAPAPYKVTRLMDKLDDKGKPVVDKDGEHVKEEVEMQVTAFKVVNTFDLSQTDGKELPSLGVNELEGNVDRYPVFIEALKQVCPVPITFEDIKGEAKGYYHTEEKRIAIQKGMSELQTIKTAIHEMAHQMLHSEKDAVKDKTRNSKEVEAESVAYTVCQHYGIDTSDYSFSYVAGWSSGKETTELKASLDVIRKAANDMITKIDEKEQELIAQKAAVLKEEKIDALVNDLDQFAKDLYPYDYQDNTEGNPEYNTAAMKAQLYKNNGLDIKKGIEEALENGDIPDDLVDTAKSLVGRLDEFYKEKSVEETKDEVAPDSKEQDKSKKESVRDKLAKEKNKAKKKSTPKQSKKKDEVTI